MSTLHEIEAAIAALPEEERLVLADHLILKRFGAEAMDAEFLESLEAAEAEIDHNARGTRSRR